LSSPASIGPGPSDGPPTDLFTPKSGTSAGELARGLLRAVRSPGTSVAVAILVVLLAMALIGPLVWTRSTVGVDLFSALQHPSWHHPMGTDAQGRDVLARFDEGCRISLTVAVIVTIVSGLIGGAIGIVAGVTGGWLDAILMRVMDAILAFPALILAMAVTVALGAGLRTAAAGIVLTAIPWYARLVRSEAIRIRSLPFVEAAAAIGATRSRIILRHVVPHLLSTVAIEAAAVFGWAILALAGLGFVGLGAQIPTPEWGAMITDGLGYALTGQWWIAVFPGLGILLAVTATGILSDSARDVLDPRGRRP
jgi:peptide/nickel transport system permease protein